MYSTTRIDRNDAKHAANKIMVEVLSIMATLGFIGVQREGKELKKKNRVSNRIPTLSAICA